MISNERRKNLQEKEKLKKISSLRLAAGSTNNINKDNFLENEDDLNNIISSPDNSSEFSFEDSNILKSISCIDKSEEIINSKSLKSHILQKSDNINELYYEEELRDAEKNYETAKEYRSEKQKISKNKLNPVHYEDNHPIKNSNQEDNINFTNDLNNQNYREKKNHIENNLIENKHSSNLLNINKISSNDKVSSYKKNNKDKNSIILELSSDGIESESSLIKNDNNLDIIYKISNGMYSIDNNGSCNELISNLRGINYPNENNLDSNKMSNLILNNNINENFVNKKELFNNNSEKEMKTHLSANNFLHYQYNEQYFLDKTNSLSSSGANNITNNLANTLLSFNTKSASYQKIFTYTHSKPTNNEINKNPEKENIKNKIKNIDFNSSAELFKNMSLDLKNVNEIAIENYNSNNLSNIIFILFKKNL